MRVFISLSTHDDDVMMLTWPLLKRHGRLTAGYLLAANCREFRLAGLMEDAATSMNAARSARLY